MNALPVCTHLLLSFVAGICWYYTPYDTSTTLLVVASLGLLYFFSIQSHMRTRLLYLAIGLLGYLGGATRTHLLQRSHDSWSRAIKAKTISFSATITDIKKTSNKQYPYALFVTTKNNLRLHLYAPSDVCCLPGDIIAVRSAFVADHQPARFQHYLQKEGVLASIFLKPENFIIQSSTKWHLNRLLFRVRNYTTKALSLKMSPFTRSLFLMILFGYKDKTASKSIFPPFTQWGTVHQLARSGLHLIIFIALWAFLLNCMPLPFMIRQLLLILIVIFYMLISWSSISIIRALSMFLLHRAFLAYKIPTHPLYIFMVTSLLVLYHNPLQLFFLDFQLSFALTGAIIVFYYIARIQYKNFTKSLRKHLVFH